MGMDMLKSMKDTIATHVYSQLGNIATVDTHELGEAIDMIKDLSEATYYCSVVEAMEKSEEEKDRGGETVYYSERIYPPIDYYMNGKGYPMGGRDYYPDAEIDMRGNGGRGYYTENPRETRADNQPRNSNGEFMRDTREGRSGMSRRTYMENKALKQPKEMQMKELEHYMAELSTDITEMIRDASPEEKQMLQKKLTTLAGKIDNV